MQLTVWHPVGTQWAVLSVQSSAVRWARKRAKFTLVIKAESESLPPPRCKLVIVRLEIVFWCWLHSCTASLALHSAHSASRYQLVAPHAFDVYFMANSFPSNFIIFLPGSERICENKMHFVYVQCGLNICIAPVDPGSVWNRDANFWLIH